MASVKISFLGGGGGYFAGILCDLAMTEGLDGSEVWVYDLDTERAGMMVALGRRLMKEANRDVRVQVATDMATAADGTDFVLSSIGGTGSGGKSFQNSDIHKGDLKIPAEYGIHQIVGDTGGPGGLMAGLRSVPPHLAFCKELEKRSPNAVFVNHSNPMAVLCRAMNKYSSLDNIVGLCHGVQNGIKYAAQLLEVDPHELDTKWIGTNHYYWFTSIRHGRRDVYPELKKRMANMEHPVGKLMTAKLSEVYGYQVTYPKDDHAVEFYPFLTQLRDLSEFPYRLYEDKHGPRIKALYCPDESEQVSEPEPTREEILKSFQERLDNVKLPEEQRTSVTGETPGQLVSAIANGRREVFIVNIPNSGSVPNLPDHAVLEVDGVTDSYGFRGVHMGEAPMVLQGMLQKKIAWQELVVDAAVKGDRNLALQALMLDEMAIRPELAEEMLDRLLENSREYLPNFFG